MMKNNLDKDYQLTSSSEKNKAKRQNSESWLLTLPSMIWLIVFFLIPYIVIIFYSFMTPDLINVKYKFSLSAYYQIFSGEYARSIYLAFELAIITTLFCLVIGYPVAYLIATSNQKMKNILLILIIIPFWTNLIIRIFSWRIFLSYNGVMNDLFMNLGIVKHPIEIMRTNLAVIIVMIYVYLPYMILPLYSVIEKFDFTLLSAAEDLGANYIKAFFHVILPLTMEGIYAGSLLVFIPSLGAYIIPQLMGNQNYLYVGQIITYKTKNIPQNWPLASAMAMIMLLIVALLLLLSYWLYQRRRKIEL